ncbi:hypothetical protein TH61_00535 [Rufibacter sp. DG15C]|uniref:hypothetical protein n=1 Tax=Rufibacter sp. DG15C TaxID=1379909 RepID=UPI00078DA329|nr:hypothetical protein [Rufibacter sp. DG15C]AMM49966.1 hypothetical protein TH61_00535 [Rufibacter sp. DG15C]
MIVLNNEVVFKGNGITLLKTYCPIREVYGLQLTSPNGTKELVADFTYVSDYFPNQGCAAITLHGEHKWIDLSLNIRDMSQTDELYFNCLYKRNSKCNCLRNKEIPVCTLCKNGIIRNPLNVRRDASQSNHDFDYETAAATYKITFHPEMAVSMRCRFLVQEHNLVDKLIDTIDHYETQDKGCNDREFTICTYEDISADLCDNYFLRSYRVEVKVIDVGLSMEVTSDKIYLDLF